MPLTVAACLIGSAKIGTTVSEHQSHVEASQATGAV